MNNVHPIFAPILAAIVEQPAVLARLAEPAPEPGAAINLQIAEARAKLAALVAEHNALMGQADVASATACEPGRNTSRFNGRAVSLRLQATQISLEEIHPLRRHIEALEARLSEVRPGVVLSFEQLRGADDMAGLEPVGSAA